MPSLSPLLHPDFTCIIYGGLYEQRSRYSKNCRLPISPERAASDSEQYSREYREIDRRISEFVSQTEDVLGDFKNFERTTHECKLKRLPHLLSLFCSSPSSLSPSFSMLFGLYKGYSKDYINNARIKIATSIMQMLDEL